MDRFFVVSENIQADRIVLTDQQAHQIRSVLRKKAGDHIIVLDNKGSEYEVVLEEIEDKTVTGLIIETRVVIAEPSVKITLYQSLLKSDKFEWVLQKCTEIGVSRFVPVVTERTLIRKPDAVRTEKLKRWHRIVTEAAEQSGRGIVPELSKAICLKEALEDINAFDLSIIASLSGQKIRQYMSGFNRVNPPDTIGIFIGPEGGFTDEEIQLAEYRGAACVNLRLRVLRTETAGLVMSSILLYELGQMEG